MDTKSCSAKTYIDDQSRNRSSNHRCMSEVSLFTRTVTGTKPTNYCLSSSNMTIPGQDNFYQVDCIEANTYLSDGYATYSCDIHPNSNQNEQTCASNVRNWLAAFALVDLDAYCEADEEPRWIGHNYKTQTATCYWSNLSHFKTIEHEVKKGETLSSILDVYAKKFNISKEKSKFEILLAFNRAITDPDKIEVDQIIKIPIPKTEYEMWKLK